MYKFLIDFLPYSLLFLEAKSKLVQHCTKFKVKWV